MMITKKSLPRRTFLRGLGATLSLPLLDAMVPALSALAKTAANPVRRLGYVYIPNGVIMANWMPAAAGSAFGFPRTLKPLEPFRDRVTVISGLTTKVVGSHAVSSVSWLTGVNPKKSVTELACGVSADQIAARHLGTITQLASLELGLEGADFTGACDGGYSCAHTNTVSWRTPSTPMPIETNPRAVFERLFGDADMTGTKARLMRFQEDRSILDALTHAIADLQRSLGAGDRTKLDQYLDAVRDVERRIARAEEQNAESQAPQMERPIGVPERFEDYAKLMFDLQVLVYQSDLTRMMTFMMGREVSNRTYPQVGVPEPHHSMSHHQDDPEKLEKNTRINTLHMELFAYYLDKLRTAPDGDGTLLDHSMIVYGGGLADPNVHAHENLPTVLVGRGAGRVKGGIHRRYLLGTPMANLHVTLLQKMDVPVEQFSDSNGTLDLLSSV